MTSAGTRDQGSAAGQIRIRGDFAQSYSDVYTPEVIVAHHQGMKIFGMSVITNESETEDPNDETTHEEVQDVAGMVEPKMTKIIEGLIAKM